jgi:hypothetical protein
MCITIATYVNIQIKHVEHTFETAKTFENTLATYLYNHYNICNIRYTFETPKWNICNIYLKRMKHSVATCAYLLVVLQWRFVDAKLDVGAELEVTMMDRQMDLSCGGRRGRRVTRGTSEGARREVQEQASRSHPKKDGRPKGIIMDLSSHMV